LRRRQALSITARQNLDPKTFLESADESAHARRFAQLFAACPMARQRLVRALQRRFEIRASWELGPPISVWRGIDLKDHSANLRTS